MAESGVVPGTAIFSFLKVKLNFLMHSIHREDISRMLKRHCSDIFSVNRMHQEIDREDISRMLKRHCSAVLIRNPATSLESVKFSQTQSSPQ